MKEITVKRNTQRYSDLFSDVMGHSGEAGVVLLDTSEDTFTPAGKLYQMLKNK